MSRLTTRVPLNREHPGVPRESIDDVFITPRVLDKSAFDQFTATLKSLIEQATSHAETLRKTSASADAVVKQFGQTGPALEQRLNSATQVLTGMEARSSHAQAITTKLEERVASAQKLEAQLEALLAQRLADFDQRLSARLQDATAKIDQARNDLAARAARLQEGLQHTIAQAQERLGGIAAAAEGEIAEKRASIERHLAELETRLTRISDDMTRYAGPGLTALTTLCDRAERLLGTTPQPESGTTETAPRSTPREGSAADTLEKLRQAQQGLDQQHERISREISSLREQAQLASKSLADSIEKSGSTIDDLDKRHERIAAAIERSHGSAESLDRRRDQIKATMLEALSLAESVQQAVNEQLHHARSQLDREVDIMRETLAAAAMVHGTSGPISVPQSPMPTSMARNADEMTLSMTDAARNSVVILEEPKGSIAKPR
jgi:chromosome segregation ATPase